MRAPRALSALATCLPTLLDLIAARAAPAQAPAPVLLEVSPPAGQPGATVRVQLAGKRLEGVTGLWFDHPGFRAARVEAPAEPGQAPEKRKSPPPPSWDITVAPEVPPGLYDLRAVSELGVSAPRAFHVSSVPLVAGRDPADGARVEVEVSSRIAGAIEAGLADRFRFKAARSGRVVVECFAERIDSKLDATLEVRDAAGRRVGFSADRVALDPALAFDAREGSEYSIDLWDFTYGGRHPYLLSISASPRLLFAFPPALSSAAGTEVTFYGWNLPGSRPAGGAAGGGAEPLEALTVRLGPAPEAPPGRIASYRKTAGLLAGALEVAPPGLAAEPLVLARAPGPLSLETEPNDEPAQATALSLPAEACGRFEAPRDRDWYSFRARKGDTLDIEVEAARLGAPCDPVILVARLERKKEVEPASVRDLLLLDERKGGFPREEAFERKFVAADRDPLASWTAPDDGEYLILVRNRNGRSGLEAVYRLRVRPQEPDFTLVAIHSDNASGEALTLPRGGSRTYDVLIERRGGFKGVVRVEVEGLPEGASCPPVHAGPGENFVPLVFSAAPEAKAWTGPVRVAGSALPAAGAAPIRRAALNAVMVYGGSENRHPLEYVHSRLSSSLLLAVREAPAPFAVKVEPAQRSAVPGGKLALQARVERREGFVEGVQLAYHGLSERALPDGNGQRPSKATMGKDKANQEIPLSVKGDAAYGEHTFVVFATAPVEYLENPLDPSSKKEKKRTTFVSNPVTVKLVPPVSIAAAARGAVPAGGALKLPFKIERFAGVEGEVEVSLELPQGAKGLSAEKAKVARDASAGEVLVKCAADAPAGKCEGAVLRAAIQHAGRRFEVREPLASALEARKAFEVASVEEARAGALRVELRRKLDLGAGEDLRLKVELAAKSGIVATGEAVLPRGATIGAALLAVPRLPVEAGNGKEGAAPLRVRIQGAFSMGEVAEEHLLPPPAPRARESAVEARQRSF